MAAPLRSLIPSNIIRLLCAQKTVTNARLTGGSRLLLHESPLKFGTSPLLLQLQAARNFHHIVKSALFNQPLQPLPQFPQKTRAYSLLSTASYIRNAGQLQRFSVTQGNIPCFQQPHRTVVRFSKNKGKKKTVKAVTSRFYRFSNGLWLRTIAGRNKKRWKKTQDRKRRNKYHVFCSRKQCKKLDLMVSPFWKERRYLPDDPFEPFQQRNFKGLSFYPGVKVLERREE